jgi:hypothetical protein
VLEFVIPGPPQPVSFQGMTRVHHKGVEPERSHCGLVIVDKKDINVSTELPTRRFDNSVWPSGEGASVLGSGLGAKRERRSAIAIVLRGQRSRGGDTAARGSLGALLHDVGQLRDRSKWAPATRPNESADSLDGSPAEVNQFATDLAFPKVEDVQEVESNSLAEGDGH